ncbi:MAG: hypothetical protein JJE45_00210 [Prolixibacteraceae bacterium]|nr:hypothetical protein [Prolixibacteraceae bacterium]
MQPTVVNVDGVAPGQSVAWKEIPLSRGLSTKVDIGDYDWLNQWKWFARKSRDTNYAYRNKTLESGKRIAIIMHREIMQTPDDMQTDHRDWDGLNNRRYNLRNCTVNQNRSWIKPRGKIQYLGVSEHRWFKKKTGTWGLSYGVSITHNGVVYDLGTTRDVIIAAKLYDAKAKELKGEFANLNFPEGKLCESDAPVKYRDCLHYNSEYCRMRCEFGAKETTDDDILLPDMEDSK